MEQQWIWLLLTGLGYGALAVLAIRRRRQRFTSELLLVHIGLSLLWTWSKPISGGEIPSLLWRNVLRIVLAYGLVILSTNRRANIDPAFIRRLRHVVEFPKSGPAERRALWHRMLAGLGTDTAPLSEAIERLAATHDLSPAQIKGAALSALYSALHEGRTVTDADLRAATEQELTKEGRAASASTVKPRRQRSPRNG